MGEIDTGGRKAGEAPSGEIVGIPYIPAASRFFLILFCLGMLLLMFMLRLTSTIKLKVYS